MRSALRTRTGAVSDVIATIALAVAARLLIGPAFLNFDAFYSLVWGDQIRHRQVPDYFAPDAPAPHPLPEAVGALLSPLGGTIAVGTLNAIGLLAIGALCVGLYRLGEALFGRLVGLVAAALLFTRVPTLVFGAATYVDIPAAALVVWAAVLEARRPRRGPAVLVLLAIAGLLRAEMWLFSLVYLVWILPARPRSDWVRLGAIAAFAPAVWLLSNALVTGSPFEPSHGTGITIGRKLLGYPNPDSRTGLLTVPDAFVRDMGNWLRPVALAVAAAGLVAGVVLRPREIRLPVAIAAVNVVAFACLGAIGLSIEQRYLAPTAAILTLLAAVGAVGWRTLPRAGAPAARAWAVIGSGALVALAAELAFVVPARIGDARTERAIENRLETDLHDLVDRSLGRAAVRHAEVVVIPSPRVQPQLALWTGRDPVTFTTTLRTPAPRHVLIAPRTPEAQRYVGAARTAAIAPAGYTRAAATPSWVLYESG